MSDREFCIARRKAEFPAFVRVLKALPEDRLDYRPDPRSRTAAHLAWVIASEERQLVSLLDTGTIDGTPQPPPKTVDAIVSAFERHSAAATERIGRIDDVRWQRKGKLLMEGGRAWEQTIAQFAWLFLFDAVHHRGQLSTYLRPMGGKCPSIYGPSADEPGGA